MEATREIYWNITGGALIYAFLFVVAIAMGRGIQRRYQLWRLGADEDRFGDGARRLGGMAAQIFGQERFRRDPFPGTAHLFIFYGFLAQGVATALISIQEWSGIHFLQGDVYRVYSLLSDGFGLLAIVGLCMALWWRLVIRPPRVHSVMDDWIALGLLLLIFVQGFVVEGLRIATTELAQRPDLAMWSPVGRLFAIALSGLSPEGLRSLHQFTWWFHAVTAFGFLAYFIYGKFNHILYGMGNVFLRNFAPTGKLEHPDIDELLETDEEALDRLGVSKIEGFSWKGLLDLDACVNCGRCESVCPATTSGVALNPRKLIQSMQGHLTRVGPSLLELASVPAGEGDLAPDLDRPPLFAPADEPDSGAALSEEEIWGCRTCGACQRECPMFIEHIPKIVDMRRHLVMTESRMSEEVQGFLKNMDDRMHPFVGASRDREEWFRDLDVKVYGNGDEADYLFWVGCAGSMVDRNIQVSRAMVKVLKAAGVDFALLGAEEVCSGDPARRVGGELTYQICAKENIENFERYGVKKIIATCPHCFNTLKNEYPDYGGRYEVAHHSEFIADLLKEGKLAPSKSLDSVTYHDPCYLGRHNEVYDEPRDVIGAVSSEGAFVEMEKNRSNSHCCGSGGGYAFMDDSPEKRINHERYEQLQGCGAKTAAVSCPFCIQMFDDAAGALDPDRTLRTADIAELVAESLEE